MSKYDDIINEKRPISIKHTPMPIENRAAQFAPFAALVGYDDAVEEMARLTDSKVELSEDARQELDEKISGIFAEALPGEKVAIKVTYFVPDDLKDGGRYVTVSGTVKKIDMYGRVILMDNGTRIRIDDIVDID